MNLSIHVNKLMKLINFYEFKLIYKLYVHQPILSETYIKRYRFKCSPACSEHKAHNTIKSEKRYTGS